MAASKTPMPPGAWLAKPSSVADTKTTASVTKPICGSSGISMYIASAQNVEIDDADADLQQRERAAGQRDLPAVAADDALSGPDPGDIERQDERA